MKSLILVRHGHSKANAQDVIVASLENGVKEAWGLTELGREQAAGVVDALRAQGCLPTDPSTRFAVYSSPFSRALETAQQIAKALGSQDTGTGSCTPPAIRLDEALRERYFGAALEGKSSDGYRDVWAQDAKDVAVGPPMGGESVLDVAARCAAFVDRVRRDETADVVFLVSHGDTLSILATNVGKLGELAQHRAHGLENCGFLVL